MRVLVACEFSGIVRDAFAARGHDAWSCDLQPSERPGNHIQADVLTILDQGWHLMIAHPPCTHLCRMSYCRPRQPADIAAAHAFVLALWDAPVARVAIENPEGRLCRLWRWPDQWIQPCMFGHPHTKKTGLWLRQLAPLTSTDVVPATLGWVTSIPGGAKQAATRSRTFTGIAAAMAEQWG